MFCRLQEAVIAVSVGEGREVVGMRPGHGTHPSNLIHPIHVIILILTNLHRQAIHSFLILILDSLDFNVSQILGLLFYLTNSLILFCSLRHIHFKCNAIVPRLSLKGVKSNFCTRACTSWFAVSTNSPFLKIIIIIFHLSLSLRKRI